MPEARWIVTEHVGRAGLAAVEADWRRLYNEMPDPSMWHSHEAYSAYVSNLCAAPERFTCCALSDGERVRAILPLEERVDRGLLEGGVGLRMRVWGMPWQKGNWDLTDAIGPEDDARRALLPAVIEHLRRKSGGPAVLALGRTRQASVLWDGFAGAVTSGCFSFEDDGEYVVPTAMSPEEFTARMSKKSRETLRRAKRRFEALDGASYERAVAPEDLARRYGAFLEVEASGWKGRHGSAIRQDPREEGFYRDLLERMSRDGRCEIHSLYAADRCIASGFWVFTRHEGVLLKCGYDESYASVSPGRLLTHESLQLCCQDPEVDSVCLFGEAPWLRHWAPDTNCTRRAYVSLRPASGAVLLALLRVRYGPVRRAVRSLRAWRRERDDRTAVQRGRDAE